MSFYITVLPAGGQAEVCMQVGNLAHEWVIVRRGVCIWKAGWFTE